MTNFGDDTYVWDIRNARKEAGIQIKNLLQTRRIKNAKLVNPAVLMGLLTTPRARAERMAELWGTDPVHASNQGYTNLAKSVMEEVKSETVVHTRKPSSVSTTTTTASTPTVALRRDSFYAGRGGWRGRGGHSGAHGGRGGHRAHGGHGHPKRGGRGHRGRL